jgi:hypothetical protein
MQKNRQQSDQALDREESAKARSRKSLARTMALFLGILWAAWWVFFTVASSAGEVIGRGQPLSPVPFLVVLALLVIVGLAWRWTLIGGILFAALGLFLLWASLYFFHNSASTTWFLILTLAAPPFLVGMMLLAGAWFRRFSIFS